MTLTLKDYLFSIVLITLLVMVVLWGIQKHRADSLAAERDLGHSLQKQERVRREYIPMKLKEKGSDELAEMGINLWEE
jgi:hypothetical protein